MKKIFIFILLFFPLMINAKCDKETLNDYTSYASDIVFEKEYVKSKGKFSVTFYNVIDEINLVYNGKTYKSSSGQVKIENIKEGELSTFEVVASNCGETVRNIYIEFPYFNSYYGSTVCKEYVGKITYCTENFTKSKVTEDLIKLAIKNYNHVLEQPEEEPIEEKPTFLEIISEFTKIWGIRVVLVLITSFITNLIFSNIYIKIKHKL